MEELYETNLVQPQQLFDIYNTSCIGAEQSILQEKSMMKNTIATFVIVLSLSSIPAFDASVALIKDTETIPYHSEMSHGKSAYTDVLDIRELSVEVEKNPIYRISKSDKRKIEQRYSVIRRSQILDEAYRKAYRSEMSFDDKRFMKFTNMRISTLKFSDSKVQFDSEDKALFYSLYFNHDIKLSLAVYMDDPNVDFTIYQKSERIVSDSIEFNQLLKKMKIILNKVETHA